MNITQQQLYFGNLTLPHDRPRRIAYYGRVSTQHEEQLEALENQMQWYEDQTKHHPNWTVIERYIDEGITGTLAKKRPAFMRMIEDAKKHHFDLIVTREVCRFARNTVDTLVITRELKNYGVEVYFVSDNIWTMDGDGELRLTIMATMAQEESRKISERVRAGHMVCRENGVLFGNGNIIGYDRQGDTYVINPEQAETIRLIFEKYASGMGEKAVVNELTRLGRKDGAGNVKWSCSKISRILRNATYMGYICYNKSRVNNFLEKKRINNLDESTYILKKGNFEPIVSEELWRYCERIRKGRSIQHKMPDGETRRRGCASPQLLWVKKLRCRCGAGYSRFHWRTLKDGSMIYGYQCNFRTQNISKSYVERHALYDQKSCDAIAICDWKLDLMAKHIFDRIWGDQKEVIHKACQMIESCSGFSYQRKADKLSNLQSKIKKQEHRILQYGVMRADGELTKAQFQELTARAEAERNQLEQELSVLHTDNDSAGPSLPQIQKALQQVIDISGPRISDELIEAFVEVVTPIENHHFRWKLNFGILKEGDERTDLTHPDDEPILTFILDFDAALQFRTENQMSPQFRRHNWNDLTVEVYI